MENTEKQKKVSETIEQIRSLLNNVTEKDTVIFGISRKNDEAKNDEVHVKSEIILMGEPMSIAILVRKVADRL